MGRLHQQYCLVGISLLQVVMQTLMLWNASICVQKTLTLAYREKKNIVKRDFL